MPPIYHHGHAPSQTLHHSWRTVTNSAPHLLPHLARLSSTSSSFPIRVLDIGCGPGTLSASLAKHLPPTARIVATDISDDVLARAREHAVREGLAEMMEFVNADVCYLPFKDGEFEVVHAHQVLCHIEDPVKAIKEMVRVVKKEGGIISLREADVRNWHCWPELEGLRKMEMLMREVMKADGGHPEAGMRLVEWCVKAGVKKSRIDMGFGSWCFAKEEDRRMWGMAMIERLKAGHLRRKSLELGITTEEEIEGIIRDWESFMATETATLGNVNGEVTIRV